MKTTKLVGRGIAAAAIAGVLGLWSVTGLASSAQEDAEDVRDKPIDKVERKLSGRGYERVGTGNHGKEQFWWSRDKDRCLRLSLDGNRVGHAEVQDENTCRNSAKHDGSRDDENSGKGQQRGTSSLIGMRASYLDDEMAQRGYRNVDGYKTGDTSYTVWWNKSMRECLSVGTKDGHVATVRSVGENECQ